MWFAYTCTFTAGLILKHLPEKKDFNLCGHDDVFPGVSRGYFHLYASTFCYCYLLSIVFTSCFTDWLPLNWPDRPGRCFLSLFTNIVAVRPYSSKPGCQSIVVICQFTLYACLLTY